MKQEQKQEIALMRYGAIAPLIVGLDEDYPSPNAFYEEVAAKGIPGLTADSAIMPPPPSKNGT